MGYRSHSVVMQHVPLPGCQAEGNENLPDNPYVYAALTREAILAWDVPDSSESGPILIPCVRNKGTEVMFPWKTGRE